jgi:hypothetical protein
MTCGCARHRYELLIEHGISTPDYCPNCVAGFEVEEDGFPVLDENFEPVKCSLCRGSGMLYEPCCPSCAEDDGPIGGGGFHFPPDSRSG